MPLITLADCNASAQLALDSGAGAHAWTYDRASIERAIAELGLARPVRIYMSNGRGGRRKSGLYRDAREHLIGVRRSLSVREASRTLWHELEHARQEESGERDPRGTARLRGDAYWSHPDEIAARAREAAHDRLALAVPA